MLHFYAEHCEHALMYFFENKKNNEVNIRTLCKYIVDKT